MNSSMIDWATRYWIVIDRLSVVDRYEFFAVKEHVNKALNLLRRFVFNSGFWPILYDLFVHSKFLLSTALWDGSVPDTQGIAMSTYNASLSMGWAIHRYFKSIVRFVSHSSLL